MTTAANFWAAVSAALVQVLQTSLHGQHNLQQVALVQFVVSGVAGMLPTGILPLHALANRELMVGLVRALAGFGMEERRLFQLAFDAIMSDTTGMLLQLAFARASGTVTAAVTAAATAYPINTTGTNVPMSNGNLPQPRPGDAPLGNSVTRPTDNGRVMAGPPVSRGSFNPWAG